MEAEKLIEQAAQLEKEKKGSKQSALKVLAGDKGTKKKRKNQEQEERARANKITRPNDPDDFLKHGEELAAKSDEVRKVSGMI